MENKKEGFIDSLFKKPKKLVLPMAFVGAFAVGWGLGYLNSYLEGHHKGVVEGFYYGGKNMRQHLEKNIAGVNGYTMKFKKYDLVNYLPAETFPKSNEDFFVYVCPNNKDKTVEIPKRIKFEHLEAKLLMDAACSK